MERERACRAVYYYSIASTRLFSQLRSDIAFRVFLRIRLGIFGTKRDGYLM